MRLSMKVYTRDIVLSDLSFGAAGCWSQKVRSRKSIAG